MNRSDKSEGRRTAGLIGAALTAGLGLCFLSVAPLGDGPRGLSYDIPFAFQATAPVDEAVIVFIDDASYQALGRHVTNNVLSRWLHVRLLETLFAARARMVVFDVFFRNAWPDPAGDAALADAIRAATNKVVLYAELKKTLAAGTVSVELLRSAEPIGSAAPWGVSNLPKDPDGRLRQHFGLDPDYPSLAWKAAELLGEAPTDPSRRRWINYYGPPGTIRHVSYQKVVPLVHQAGSLTNGLAPTDVINLFADKVVFVGGGQIMTPSGPDRSDRYSTPPGRWTGEQYSGVEIHATIFLNLLRGDWLSELPFLFELLLVIGCGCLFGMGLAWMRPWVAAGMALLSFLGLAVLALLIVWHWRVWFPWLTVGAVQIPCACGWSLLVHLRRPIQENAPLSEQRLEGRIASGAELITTRQTEALGPSPLIPDHTLLRCVGCGGYGEVWLARDIVGSFHAVKLIHRKNFSDAKPFEREFQGIQQYSPISRLHPGWVHILHVGHNEAAGYFFYIMELGDDEATGQQVDPDRYTPKTLASELRKRGKLPLVECLDLSVALAGALEQLHQHGLVHRDIKPSNVIYVNGQPKFTDIGLVTAMRGPEHDVSLVGTAGYMAPEGPGTPAADVFSLGMLIYEAGMGREHGAFPELPTDVLQQPQQAHSSQLGRIILTACESDPEARYPSAAALQADLERLRAAIKPD